MRKPINGRFLDRSLTKTQAETSTPTSNNSTAPSTL
jgi:hypothetical protein